MSTGPLSRPSPPSSPSAPQGAPAPASTAPELCTHRATSFVRATVFYNHGDAVRLHRCVRCGGYFFSRASHGLTAQQQAAIITIAAAFEGREFSIVSSGSQEFRITSESLTPSRHQEQDGTP